jgi:hypothetical protein
MSKFQLTVPTRSFYTSSLPISKDDVNASDPFYFQRKSIERNQQFRPAIYGDSEGTLNVNTDRMKHRPSDIIDHMTRPKPLSTMNIN